MQELKFEQVEQVSGGVRSVVRWIATNLSWEATKAAGAATHEAIVENSSDWEASPDDMPEGYGGGTW